MNLAREATIGLLDVIRRGRLGKPENLIVVALCCGMPVWQPSSYVDESSRVGRITGCEKQCYPAEINNCSLGNWLRPTG